MFFTFNIQYSLSKKYLCTKYNHVNFRNGPGVKFPILYKVYKKDYPLEIIDTIEGWHAVVDFKGEKMWVSSINLSSKCGGIVRESVKAEVKIKPEEDALTLFILEEGFTIKNLKCYTKWCLVEVEDKSGWVLKSLIWGI